MGKQTKNASTEAVIEKTNDNKKDITKKLPRVYTYFLYFIIFAFIGWLLETCYSFYSLGHFTKRGFLFGPLCPIYGFGAAILIMSTKKLYGKPFKKFLIATIAFTVFEYFVSLILEMLFGLRWWDYSNDFLNIQGRVSLLYSIFWGLIGLFLINLKDGVIK